jgi:hypothetical protein
LVWLRDFYGLVLENGVGDESISTLISSDMRLLHCVRLLHCSPEDADSIWFWQFLEASTAGFHTVLSEETVKDMLSQYVPEHHGDKTPLQLASVFAACCLSTSYLPRDQSDKFRCLEVIIAAVIASGAELNEGNHHHTPLLLFLTTMPACRKYWEDDSHNRPRDMRSGLMVWLEILQRAGVDLVTYGAEESRHFKAYRLLETPVPPLLHWHNTHSLMFSDEVFYFNISYGPKPEDWTAQLDHMFDQYIGDFWRMPGLLDETEVQVIPGAWIDGV